MAKKSKKSLNEVVNELIRKGMQADNIAKEAVEKYDVDKYSKHLGRFPGIDYDNLTKVQQEMDDAEWLEKHGRS